MKDTIPTSILVLGISGLSYAVAYAFQWSFLRHFEINYKMIELSTNLLVVSVLATISFYFIITPILSSLAIFSNTINKGPATNILSRQLHLSILLALIVYLVLGGLGVGGWPSFKIAVAVSFGFLIMTELEVIIWIILRRSVKKGYVDYHNDKKKMYDRHSLKGGDSVFDKNFELVIFTILIMSVGLFAGKQFASVDSTRLPVIQRNEKITEVIVDRSGDMLITKTYDTATKEPLPGYGIFKLSSTDPLRVYEKFNANTEN